MKQFEVGKTYKNRSGDDVHIVANDLSGDYSLAGTFMSNEYKRIVSFCDNGKYSTGNDSSFYDLIPESCDKVKKTKPVKKWRWVFEEGNEFYITKDCYTKQEALAQGYLQKVKATKE